MISVFYFCVGQNAPAEVSVSKFSEIDIEASNAGPQPALKQRRGTRLEWGGGTRIKVRKTLSWVGEECPLPSRLDVWVSVVNSPRGIRGTALVENAFLYILGSKNTTGRQKMRFLPIFLMHVGN